MLMEMFWASLDTTIMVLVATSMAALLGGALGIATACTRADGISPQRFVHGCLDTILNVGRSVPFIILMVAVMPLTRLLVGTSVGLAAAIVPLTCGATPFYGRLAQLAIEAVDPALIEMGHSLGASRRQLVGFVLLSEARAPLVGAVAVTMVTLVSYSAMAGAVGGGGLGDLALRYGYQRFDTGVMLWTTGIMVALVQAVQKLGDLAVNALDKRVP